MSRLNFFGGPRSEVDDALDLHLGDTTGLAAASPLRGGDNTGTFSVSSMTDGGVTIVESAVSGMTFDSPDTSGGDGEFASGINSVEPNRCLFVNNDKTKSMYCYGIVGGTGEKFCMKKLPSVGSDHCGTAAHDKKVSTLKENYIYFRDYARQNGYVTPEFPGTHPMAATLYKLNDDLLNRLHYKEIIEMIDHRDVTDKEGLVAARERVLKSDLGVSFTPRKKPRFTDGDGGWYAPSADSMPTIPEVPNLSDNPLGPALDNHITSNWPAIISTVSILKSHFAKSEKYEEEISRLGDELDGLSASVARIQTLLGTPADGSKFNLFETVDDLEAAVVELDTKVDAIKKGLGGGFTLADDSIIKGRIGTVETSLQKLVAIDLMDIARRLKTLETASTETKAGKPWISGASTSFGGQGAGTDEAPSNARLHQVLSTQVVPAIKDLWRLYSILTMGPSAAGVVPGSGVPAGQALFQGLEGIEKYVRNVETQVKGASDVLENRLNNLEAEIGHMKTTQNSTGGGSQQTPAGGGYGNLFGNQGPGIGQGSAGGGGDGWNGGFASFSGSGGGGGYGGGGGNTPPSAGADARIATLEAQVVDLEAQMNNTTVTIAGHSFKSQEDCEVFVQTHVPRCTYEQFFDMVSLLQRSWGQNHKGLKQSWEETYNRSRAGFKSKNEAIISASLETIIPTCLGENTGKVSEAVKPLTGVPTRHHWENNGGMSGKRHDINECIQKIQTTLDTQQKLLFAVQPVGAAVARELLTQAKSHWKQYESMLDKFFDEFVRYSPREEAWELCGLIGKTVLEIVYEQRAIAADLTDMMTDAQRGGRVLWATLQAHRVLNEFEALTYRNHPRIAPVIVLHLLQNRIAKSEFENLKDTCKSHQKSIDKLVTAVENLKKKS